MSTQNSYIIEGDTDECYMNFVNLSDKTNEEISVAFKKTEKQMNEIDPNTPFTLEDCLKY